MKKLLITLLFPVLCTSQIWKDTIPITSSYTMISSNGLKEVHNWNKLRYTNCYKLWVGPDSLHASITCDSIGKVEITGQPMFVIRMLLEQIIKMNKIEMQLQDDMNDFMYASVGFSNHIPDIWKTKQNNCKWIEYNNQMKKHGFLPYKVTKKHTCK